MKASEVIKRYLQGETDFRRANLRGQFFKGQDLSGADFSEADIRGTNFKEAILRGAKFTKAKAGLQKRWTITLVLISWLISALSGFLFAVIGYIVSLIFDASSVENQIAGWVSLIVLIVFYTIVIRKGVVAGLGAIAVAIAGAIAVAVAIAVALATAGVVAGAIAVAFAAAGAVGVAFAAAIAGSVAGLGAVAG